MSEIRILNLCHKKMILVDIYWQSLLTVKIRRRIFLDFQLTLSYILESNLILWFLIREWNHAFGKKYMSKKKEGKRKENDPVLFFRDSLPELNKDWTVIQVLYNWVPLSSLCFMTFLFLEPKLRVTSSLWNMFLIGISNMLINSTWGYFFQASTGLCSLVLWSYS